LRGDGVGVCSVRGVEYDEQLNDSARYMQQQANNWGTTSVYLAFAKLFVWLSYTSLPRFTAVVVVARCVGFSDSGIG
jgi:hypothetical protein